MIPLERRTGRCRSWTSSVGCIVFFPDLFLVVVLPFTRCYWVRTARVVNYLASFEDLVLIEALAWTYIAEREYVFLLHLILLRSGRRKVSKQTFPSPQHRPNKHQWHAGRTPKLPSTSIRGCVNHLFCGCCTVSNVKVSYTVQMFCVSVRCFVFVFNSLLCVLCVLLHNLKKRILSSFQ
jgi:hypothetical protein